MRIACLVLLIMAAVVFLCPLAFAIETSVCAPTLGKGARALQFEIGYNFQLSPFQGATLSYEKFLRDRLAMRVGIGASMDYECDDYAFDLAGETVGHGDADLTNWNHQYSLVCQLVSYRGGRGGFYYGGGPKVIYANYRNEDIYVSGYDDVIYTSQSALWRRTWGVGVCGVVGVQWLVSDRFRLHGEYGTSLMFRHQDETSVRVDYRENYDAERETNERSAVGLSSDGTRLGLSVSF